MKNRSNLNSPFNKRLWSLVPLGLYALLIFSGSCTLFTVYFFYASDELRSAIVPHTGWIGIYLYMFFFILSVLLILSQRSQLRKHMVFGFAILFIYGIFNYFMYNNRENYGNPYLTYGTYKPIWDIAIPLMWAVVLSSKPVKAFCSNNGI